MEVKKSNGMKEMLWMVECVVGWKGVEEWKRCGWFLRVGETTKIYL